MARPLEVLLGSLEAAVGGCRSLGLRCTDPPFMTSRLLERLGYGPYEQRSAWEYARSLEGSPVELYKYLDVRFSLVVKVVSRKLLHIDGWMPADYIDCQLAGPRCRVSPRGMAALAYVDGVAGGAEIRLNLVRLLHILDTYLPGSASRLVAAVRAAAAGDVASLQGVVLDLLQNESVRVFLPKVPKDAAGLAALSPAIRRASRRP